MVETFRGKTLHDAHAPAIIVDKAVVERNCQRMLDACRTLDVEFRPHTKTHKVTRKTSSQFCTFELSFSLNSNVISSAFTLVPLCILGLSNVFNRLDLLAALVMS